MKYIKIFETFNSKNLEDYFLEFEDKDFKINIHTGKIVEGRDDWTGNFMSTKVRLIVGKKFISYNKDVKLISPNGMVYTPTDAIIVRAVAPVRQLTEYEKTNDEIKSPYDKFIIEQSKRILSHVDAVKLYGVHSEWYTFNQTTLMDVYVFAFKSN